MLEFFTTIPGILVICGIILLVIAVILLVSGSKKDAIKTNSVVANEVKTENVQPVAPTPVVEPVAAVEVAQPVVEPSPVVIEEVQPVTPVVMESVQPVVEEVQAIIEPAPVVVEEVQPVVTVEPTVIAEVTPVVEEVKPVTIYGGNDPLEATQALPKMEEVHEPYGGVSPEVSVVEPVVEEVEISLPDVVIGEEISTGEEEVVAVPAMPEVVIEAPVVEEIQPVVAEEVKPVSEPVISINGEVVSGKTDIEQL